MQLPFPFLTRTHGHTDTTRRNNRYVCSIKFVPTPPGTREHGMCQNSDSGSFLSAIIKVMADILSAIIEVMADKESEVWTNLLRSFSKGDLL